MKIPSSIFPNQIPQGIEYQIIDSIKFINNRLVENFFHNHKTKKTANFYLDDRKGNPIYFDENDCEWLSPTFIRNKEELYGFTVIIKSNSTKLFLTRIKAKVDFDSLQVINKYYVKDKKQFYFGPGGKVIKENTLNLFYDETYRKEYFAFHPEKISDPTTKLWNTQIATSGEKVYWKGSWQKDLHSSLKQITKYCWADDYSVFEFNLQRLKKIEGVDRNSLSYINIVKGNLIEGFVTDKFKPCYCYYLKREPNDADFEWFAPLFEEKRNELSQDYWWYKMEKIKKSS